MKIGHARNILGTLWLIGSVLFLVILFLKSPQMQNADERQEVWKQAPALVSPMLALVMAFFFGVPDSKKNEELENNASFYAALFISLMHLLVLSVATFVWQNPIIDNLKTANLFVGYFSTVLTIPALSFFFLRASVGNPGRPGSP